LGKLVKFQSRRKPTTTAKTVAGAAQILIFTGVRYERGTSPTSNNSIDPSRPKRRRG
jgi:hypothetical protein